MKNEIREKMVARIEQLREGVTIADLKVVNMGCCGRSDGSYRCSSK